MSVHRFESPESFLKDGSDSESFPPDTNGGYRGQETQPVLSNLRWDLQTDGR